MTVLRAAASPDGRYRAELVVFDVAATALDANVLTVMLYEEPRRDGGLSGSDREAVLETQLGRAMTLRWDGPRHLVLSCPGCGIGREHLMRSEGVWKDVVITHDGFPARARAHGDDAGRL